MNLSEVLKTQRVAQRYSIRELARATGISHSYIAQLEAGNADKTQEKRVKPSFDILSRLGAVLGEQAYQQLMESAGHFAPPAFKPTSDLAMVSESMPAAQNQLIMAFHRLVNDYVRKEPAAVPELKTADNQSGETVRQTADSTEDDNQSSSDVFKQLVVWSDADNNPAYRYLLSALTFREQGSLDKSIDAFESALRRTTNWVLRGDIDRLLGRLYSQDYQHVRALSHFKKSFDALSSFLQPPQTAHLCAEIAWLCCLVDSPSDAIEYYERGLELIERHDEIDSDLARDLHHGLATAHSYVANFNQALKLDRRGFEIAEKAEDERGLAWSTFALAMDEFNLGDWVNAKKHFHNALQASHHRTLPALEAICSNELGNLFLATGELDNAMRSCEHALTINMTGKLIWGIPHSYELKGKICLANQDVNQAFFYIGSALSKFSSLSCEFRMVTSQLALSEVCISVGNYDQAHEACSEALAIANKRNYRLGAAIAHRNLGIIYLKQGVASRSRDELTKSLRELENIGHTYELARSCLAFASWGRRAADSNLTRKYESRASSLFKRLRIGEAGMALSGQSYGAD